MSNFPEDNADFDLSMGFYDDADSSRIAGDYDAFPEGDHPVNGIFDYGSRDEQGTPFYKNQNGRVQALVKLRLAADGSEGPPMYCTAADLALLVVAFGGDVQSLPKDRNSVMYLNAVLEQCNAKGKKQTAHVNGKGWVTWLTGTNLPVNTMFRLKLANIRSVSGKTGADLRFELEKKYGKKEVVYVDFEVSGTHEGKRTIYDGAQLTVQMENPFNGSAEVGGRHYPKVRKSRDGAQLIGTVRLSKLVAVYWPEMSEYEWEADATRSDFGVNEAEDPIVVIGHYALQSGRVGVGFLTLNKNQRPFFDLKNLMTLEGAAGANIVIEDDQPQQGADESANYDEAQSALDVLVDYIDSIVVAEKGVSAFEEGTIKFSAAGGTEWAGRVLKPLWESLENMPEKKVLKNLSEDQARRLFDALAESRGEGGKVSAPAVEPAAVEEEEEPEF